MKMRGWTGLGVMGLGFALAAGAVQAAAQPAAAKQGAAVLTVAETTKLLPDKVYFKGQSATTQLRNSGGVRFSDGLYVLATTVDTSGYSSDIAQKYQAYLIAETAIAIEGQPLAAGVYGMGFVDGKFVVQDVGAHTLLTVDAHKDEAMKRPTPLKVVAEGGGYRLYAGRSYVGFEKK